MQLIEISPFIRFANEAVVPRRKEPAFCADCRLMFITEGIGKININGKKFDFCAGTLLFWQSKTFYRFFFKDNVKALVIDFDLFSNGNNSKEIIPLIPLKSPELNKTKFSVYSFSDAYVLNSPIVISNAFFIKEKIIKIIEEFKKQTPFSNTNASAYLKLCISKFSDRVMSSGKNTEIAKKIDFVTNYINENFQNSLSNEHLAELVGYHQYYLNRVFKQATGYTLHQYILNCRLSFSADLLLSTYYNITEIAEKSGFNNQISFINAFKNLYKLTPTEFRNKTL